MNLKVQSHLDYSIKSPSTILCSLSCVQTSGQSISNEFLTIDRNVERSDLSVGFEENRFTKLFINEPGPLGINYSASVQTTPNTHAVSDIEANSIRNLEASAIPYLFPSRYAPADRIRGAAMDIFGDFQTAYDKVIAIEDWLYEHIEYQYGSSQEQTWASDTLETRMGVCRDFAHLGIAFCRALTIPARYVTVYAYGLEPQDFHAVFEAYINGTWYIFDGTRKAPLNGFVKIAMGRDASDAAVATLFGNIVCEGMSIESQIIADENQQIDLVSRDDLRERNQVLFLS